MLKKEGILLSAAVDNCIGIHELTTILKSWIVNMINSMNGQSELNRLQMIKNDGKEEKGKEQKNERQQESGCRFWQSIKSRQSKVRLKSWFFYILDMRKYR
jgi:hypothetical protein